MSVQSQPLLVTVVHWLLLLLCASDWQRGPTIVEAQVTHRCTGTGAWADTGLNAPWSNGVPPIAGETSHIIVDPGCNVSLEGNATVESIEYRSGGQIKILGGTTLPGVYLTVRANITVYANSSMLIGQNFAFLLAPNLTVAGGELGLNGLSVEVADGCGVELGGRLSIYANTGVRCRDVTCSNSSASPSTSRISVAGNAFLRASRTLRVQAGQALELFGPGSTLWPTTDLPLNTNLSFGDPTSPGRCPDTSGALILQGIGNVALYGCSYVLTTNIFATIKLALVGGTYSLIDGSTFNINMLTIGTNRDQTGPVLLQTIGTASLGVGLLRLDAPVLIKGLNVQVMTSMCRGAYIGMDHARWSFGPGPAGSHSVFERSLLMREDPPGVVGGAVILEGDVSVDTGLVLNVTLCIAGAGSVTPPERLVQKLDACKSSSSVGSSSSWRSSSSSLGPPSSSLGPLSSSLGPPSSSLGPLSSSLSSSATAAGPPSSSSGAIFTSSSSSSTTSSTSSSGGGGGNDGAGGGSNAATGIGIGVALGAVVGLALVWFVCRRRRQQRHYAAQFDKLADSGTGTGTGGTGTGGTGTSSGADVALVRATTNTTTGPGPAPLRPSARNAAEAVPGLTARSTFSLIRGSSTVETIKFDQIKLMKECGTGFSSVVYKALWHGTEVAFKLLRAQDARGVAELESEMYMALAIGQHPRVVPFLGACVDTPHLGLVLNFMPYGSIEQYLGTAACRLDLPTGSDSERHQFLLNLKRLTQMMADSSAALLHCHEKGVIHRDIAARNFLIDEQRRVHISDFGLSMTLRNATDVHTGDNSEMLPIKWCAPETLRHRRWSQQTDVYSFGIFLWELVAQSAPYPDLDVLRVAAGVAEPVDSKRPMRPTISGHCPVEVAELMAQCWAEDPSKRPSMEQVNTALLSYRQNIDYRESNAMTAAGAQSNAKAVVSDTVYAAPDSFSRMYHAVDGRSIGRVAGAAGPKKSGASSHQAQYAVYQYHGLL